MILCGTGHRPDKLGGYSQKVFDGLIKLARNYLLEIKPSMIISGMALGWDQALATASHRLAIPYVAAIPFKGQERMWPQSSKTQWAQLVGDAMDVVYVCDEGYAPWKMQKRNEWMVDHAHVVLALWNGTSGGTANCVRYADKMGKPVVNVWERYEQAA